jgi:phage terminase Nu1 subunit (DNA packaging protein)
MSGKRRVWRMQDAAPAILQVDRDKLDPSQEIARANATRADAQEMRNAVMRRELAPSELVTSAVASTASQMSAILNAVPAELKRANTALTATDIAIVRRALARARNAAANVQIDWASLDG